MKKFLGSIIIMLILSQPVSADCAYNIETVSIHIFQEYKNFSALSIAKKDEEQDTTIEDLSDTMDLVTNLLKVKNETISTIQNIMSEKAKNRETMNTEQINKFQEFAKYTQEKNVELQTALKEIDSKKDLKAMQEAVFKTNIDYNKLSSEITSIKNSQESAIASLTNIISMGNGVLEIL